MPKFETTRRTGHAPDRMFALVADVEKYPQFLPLCEALTVRSRRERDGRTVLVAGGQSSREDAERRAAEAGSVLELVAAPTPVPPPATGYDIVVLHGALVAREHDLAIVSDAVLALPVSRPAVAVSVRR